MLQHFTPGMVENSLINASINCVEPFNRLVTGLLGVAREQLAGEQIMMLQKYFAILDANI